LLPLGGRKRRFRCHGHGKEMRKGPEGVDREGMHVGRCEGKGETDLTSFW
jgi:hypothetical protein